MQPTELTERTVVPDEPIAFARTVMRGGHLDRLPAGLRNAFVSTALGRLPEPLRADHVRLNLDAVA